MTARRRRREPAPKSISNPIALVESSVLDKPIKDTPSIQQKHDPALVSAAVKERNSRGLQIGSFIGPEEHNASIKMRYGRYKRDDRRTWPLNRDEVAQLYGEEAMLRLFPNP